MSYCNQCEGCPCRLISVECLSAHLQIITTPTLLNLSDAFWNGVHLYYIKGIEGSKDYQGVLGDACYNEFCADVKDGTTSGKWYDLYSSITWKSFCAAAFDLHYITTKNNASNAISTPGGMYAENDNKADAAMYKILQSDAKTKYETMRFEVRRYLELNGFECCKTTATECCKPRTTNKKFVSR